MRSVGNVILKVLTYVRSHVFFWSPTVTHRRGWPRGWPLYFVCVGDLWVTTCLKIWVFCQSTTFYTESQRQNMKTTKDINWRRLVLIVDADSEIRFHVKTIQYLKWPYFIHILHKQIIRLWSPTDVGDHVGDHNFFKKTWSPTGVGDLWVTWHPCMWVTMWVTK